MQYIDLSDSQLTSCLQGLDILACVKKVLKNKAAYNADLRSLNEISFAREFHKENSDDMLYVIQYFDWMEDVAKAINDLSMSRKFI